MDELKPCPFCGGEVQILGAREEPFREDRPCFIYCPKCQFETGIYANAQITTRKWNHRAAPENKPLTVGDYFRSLSNEELAGLLIDAEGAGYNDDSIAPKDEHGYSINMLDWLNQPYARKPEQEEK